MDNQSGIAHFKYMIEFGMHFNSMAQVTLKQSLITPRPRPPLIREMDSRIRKRSIHSMFEDLPRLGACIRIKECAHKDDRFIIFEPGATQFDTAPGDFLANLNNVDATNQTIAVF